MVGQSVLGEASEKQAKVTHDTVLRTHGMVMEDLLIVKKQLAMVCEERNQLEALLTDLHIKSPNIIKQIDE